MPRKNPTTKLPQAPEVDLSKVLAGLAPDTVNPTSSKSDEGAPAGAPGGSEEQAEPVKLLGDLQGLESFDTPSYNPNIQVSDEPFAPVENTDQPTNFPNVKVVPQEPAGPEPAVPAPTVTARVPDTVTSQPLEAETLIPSSGLHYEQRIQVLDAFKYPGQLTSAPEWVDRNWVGWASYDALRDIEPGPCLQVPTYRGDIAIVRPGDYVVRQTIKDPLNPHLASQIQLEVWARETFERMFIATPIASEDAA